MIKAFTIRSQFHLPKHPKSNSTIAPPKFVPLTPNLRPQQTLISQIDRTPSSLKSSNPNPNGKFNPKGLMIGAVSVGVVMLALGMDGRALALGPEGPLMEEFWENVRRYGLYALTVSTGVLWAVLQPIYELLKNPISALLVIIIAVGGFYIMTQVLNAMIGVTEFSYQYYY